MCYNASDSFDLQKIMFFYNGELLLFDSAGVQPLDDHFYSFKNGLKCDDFTRY